MVHRRTSEDNLRLLKEGDEPAFESIYNAYADKLFTFIYAKIKVKEAAEEIIQEIFVSLWSNRHTLQIHSTLEAYLFGAAKNKILSYIRSEKVRKKYAAEFTRFAAEQYDNSVVEEANIRELQLAIQQRMAELPAKCQLAFKMSRVEHTPIPQIAEKMNISTRTVENYISQALRYLRTSLGELLTLAILVLFN